VFTQTCFGLPAGTYRLGIVLLSHDRQSQHMLHGVELSSGADKGDCDVSDNFAFGWCSQIFFYSLYLVQVTTFSASRQ